MFRITVATLLLTAGLSAAQVDLDTLPPEGPLHAVIPALYGEEVLPYDGEQLEWIETALARAMEEINAHGITAKRVNEVGNEVEDYVVEALRQAAFTADRPTARSGRQRASGYPDIEASRGEDAFYFEIKTYHPDTEGSSQRTFYLSPSSDPKVTHPAHHLLIAFAMVPRNRHTYFAQSVRLVDLYALEVSLKFEYNASNRDLYGHDGGTLIEIQAAAEPAGPEEPEAANADAP